MKCLIIDQNKGIWRKTWNFLSVHPPTKKGGVIFNPKKYTADFGNFKQGFLIMKLIQKSNFRVLAIIPPRIYATISVLKICNIILQK